jgi:hypothetical protein
MNPRKIVSSFFRSLQKKIKKSRKKSSPRVLHRSKVMMLLVQIQIQLSLYSEQGTIHAVVSRRTLGYPSKHLAAGHNRPQAKATPFSVLLMS